MVRIAGWKRPAIFFLKVKNKIPKYVNDLIVWLSQMRSVRQEWKAELSERKFRSKVSICISLSSFFKRTTTARICVVLDV